MPRDKVDLAKRCVEAYNRRDVDGAFAELATADFEWWPALTRAYEGGECYRGREGVEQFVADTNENWEQLQIVADEFRDLGDRVLTLGRLNGRGKCSGAPVDQPYTTILDFAATGSGACGPTSIAPRGFGRAAALRVGTVHISFEALGPGRSANCRELTGAADPGLG